MITQHTHKMASSSEKDISIESVMSKMFADDRIFNEPLWNELLEKVLIMTDLKAYQTFEKSLLITEMLRHQTNINNRVDLQQRALSTFTFVRDCWETCRKSVGENNQMESPSDVFLRQLQIFTQPKYGMEVINRIYQSNNGKPCFVTTFARKNDETGVTEHFIHNSSANRMTKNGIFDFSGYPNFVPIE